MKTCNKPKVEAPEKKALISSYAWGDEDEDDLHEGFKGMCLMASPLGAISNQVDASKSKWYKDSGCSCHMTGHKDILSLFHNVEGGNISFGNKDTGGIIGHGRVQLNSAIDVKIVNFVKNLQFNLLSVSQF